MTDFLGFRYAEMGKSKNRVYVYFYARHPETGKLERKRIYLSHIKSKANRIRYAKRLINHINNKLDHGWNPWTDNSENKKKYTTIDEALNFVMTYKSKYIRARSIPQYRHRMNVLKEWLEAGQMLKSYIFDFTEEKAHDFINHLIMTKNIQAKTVNNYLLDYRTFFNTLVKNNYINKNPFQAVDKLPETQTSKRPFSDKELNSYVEYVKQHDYKMYIISMYTYCCGLRPAEICRLKIRDIHLDKGFIHISGEMSKNKQIGIIPIPFFFLEELKKYLDGQPDNFYICGHGLVPAQRKTFPTRIAERFREIANKLGISKEVVFYALKDTAADKLIANGFSSKDIRDLFRHSNISVTDAYLKKRNLMVNDRLISDFPKPF
jgi:integrase